MSRSSFAVVANTPLSRLTRADFRNRRVAPTASPSGSGVPTSSGRLSPTATRRIRSGNGPTSRAIGRWSSWAPISWPRTSTWVGIARTFTEAGGQVIQEVYPPLGSVDFAPFLAQIRRDADVVATFFAGADAIRFVKQYEEYGLKGKIPIIGKGLTQGDVLPKMGESAVGIVSAIHWVPAVDTPENRRFMEAYAAKYKRPAVDMAEQGYVGAQAIARALEAVKGNVEDQAGFLAALKAVEFNGPRGKVRFDAFQNVVHTVHILNAYSGDRDRSVRAIVITRSGDRDR